MKKNKIIIALSVLIVFFMLPVFFHEVEAVSCNGMLVSDNTIEASCTFDGTTSDGVDDGQGASNSTVLIIDKGGGVGCPSGVATLTINADQQIAVGSISLGCGAIVISTDTTEPVNQKLAVGTSIWLVDADNDGYPAATTTYLQSSAPAGGIRKALVANPTTLDCCDSSAVTYPGSPIAPQTSANSCSSFDYNCDGSSTKSVTAVYACNQTSCDAHHWTLTTGYVGSSAACGVAGTYRTATTAGTCAQTSCTYTETSPVQACN